MTDRSRGTEAPKTRDCAATTYFHRPKAIKPCVVCGMQAMEIIQRNERGRQGKARAQLLKELREEEKRRRIYDATDQLEMDPEIAAANIQVSHRFLLVPVSRALHRERRPKECPMVGYVASIYQRTPHGADQARFRPRPFGNYKLVTKMRIPAECYTRTPGKFCCTNYYYGGP